MKMKNVMLAFAAGMCLAGAAETIALPKPTADSGMTV